jgi:1,4-alpha-glucan branching enzyme
MVEWLSATATLIIAASPHAYRPLNSPASPIPHSVFARLAAAREYDPYAVLGPHADGQAWLIRVFAPRAQHVWLETSAGLEAFTRDGASGGFICRSPTPPPANYRLRVDSGGVVRAMFDPYALRVRMDETDLYLFNQGKLLQAYESFGAHAMQVEGVHGTRFAVWAPNAERVSVLGEFNAWDGRVHPMQSQGASGVWCLFLPEIEPGTLYKFEIRNRASGVVMVKSDPFAAQYELRPGNAACVAAPSSHTWCDGAWIQARANWDWQHAPLNIYELHAGSWRKHPDGRAYTYRELADALVPYLTDMGYTHVELLPITEHPLDESWGYQTTGYFAPTRRFGTPDDLRYFVDRCHRDGIGVILDWVPAHFPRDDFALAHFDGTALFEHEDPRLGLHQDWGTHIFNYARNEVRGFLLASAHFWLARFHFDGLRVDAVASMLYLDYSRAAGEWLPNRYGGRENIEAIEFLRELNVMLHEHFPGALSIAEESTAWPMVSRPTYVGGLGFSMKWNMGWMNDTLRYFSHDPIHRRFHHDSLTFGQLYAYTENFVLPFSHDEVVHGKRALLEKMPGDAWQQFANVRLLLAYQATTPGKKLNFMGNELGVGREWHEHRELDWALLQHDFQRGVQQLCRDLNHLYRDVPALHELDFDARGFEWIDCHDADQSTLSFLRRARDGSFVVVLLNFTPVPRHGYRIGVPRGGRYREIFNSDSRYYAGSDLGNANLLAEARAWMGRTHSIALSIPPLAALILQPEGV